MYFQILCFLSAGILTLQDTAVSAGTVLSQTKQLQCTYETTHHLFSTENPVKLKSQLLLGSHEAPDAEIQHADSSHSVAYQVTFIKRASSVDIIHILDVDVDKLECTISHYFTQNTQVLWPGIHTGAHQTDAWFTATIRHTDGAFIVRVFFFQLQNDFNEKESPGSILMDSSDTLHVSAVFVVYSRSPVVHSGLQKESLLHCAFSVDHQAEVTITWSLKQKGQTKLLFKYSGLRKHVEQKAKRAEMFLEEIPKGNASLLLRNVTLEDQGTYSCLVSVASLYGEQDIKLEVLESPKVALSAHSLSLVEGEDEKLVCDITHYYPLDVQVQWLRDRSEDRSLPELVKNVLFSSHRFNADGTYSLSSFFMLKASLVDNGARYTCRVEHKSLRSPIRKSVKVTVTASYSWIPWLLISLIFVFAGLLYYLLRYHLKVNTSTKRKPY